ncbi:MAG TPA: serine/threonine-protein kinase [Actinospica sp.]|jgi:serine/threonine-protein kinase|nr:serine/threonine-protein kinase [Actinospica sp.]
MPGPPIALEPGRLVAGRYRLLRPLGSGASAYVWAARDESLGREVAVKALSGSTAQGGHERERLQREAQLLAALDDPRITTVFDYAETTAEDGTSHPVLVTELVEGANLGVVLKSGPLEPQQALTVCAQVAEALCVAHRAGVVHRDVKPGNVMLTVDGAKLLDFGISRRDSDTDLTGNVLIGTPACMAPEQWRGKGAQPASDVYAVGCLLYWCLSGRAPYADRELAALGIAHLQDAPPPLPLPGRHRAVDEVYRSCLRKDPATRPSATRVAAVLGAADVRPVPAAPVRDPQGTATVPMRPPRRRARLAAVLASLGLAVAAAIVLPLTLMTSHSSGHGPAGSGAASKSPSATRTVSTAGMANAASTRSVAAAPSTTAAAETQRATGVSGAAGNGNEKGKGNGGPKKGHGHGQGDDE